MISVVQPFLMGKGGLLHTVSRECGSAESNGHSAFPCPFSPCIPLVFQPLILNFGAIIAFESL